MEASPSLLTLSKTLASSPSHRHCLISLSSTRSFTRRRFTAVDIIKTAPFTSKRLLSVSGPVCCAYGGGSGDIGGGGGGGGDDDSESGNSKVGGIAGGSDDVSAISPDVIILDVRGMTCGGCAASVKRILESQPQVSSASVNLATETAVVWLASEAKVVPNWQQEVGETLAKQLTSCGFQSNLRGVGEKEGDVPL